MENSSSESVFAEYLSNGDLSNEHLPNEHPEAAVPPANFQEIKEAYYNALEAEAVRMFQDNNIDLSEADIRFSTSLNLRRVRRASVCIIGAGGLGNWQWRILASMGFGHIIIYDDDTVGIENVGPQAHSLFDIGLPKVEAVARAALQYRGIRIVARNKRVQTMRDIINDLGYTPDIVIGCTDSAEFRNGFVESFRDISMETDLPELFMDYRMALGDWVGYFIPVRKMHSLRMFGSIVWHNYMAEACFPPEQALQEPCTERAIAYTGASVASYTGAYLHWYFSVGKALLTDYNNVRDYFLENSTSSNFTWKVSYSSRDWESITDTVQVRKLRSKLRKDKQAYIAEQEAQRNSFHKALNLSLAPMCLTYEDVLWAYTDGYSRSRDKEKAYGCLYLEKHGPSIRKGFIMPGYPTHDPYIYWLVESSDGCTFKPLEEYFPTILYNAEHCVIVDIRNNHRVKDTHLDSLRLLSDLLRFPLGTVVKTKDGRYMRCRYDGSGEFLWEVHHNGETTTYPILDGCTLPHWGVVALWHCTWPGDLQSEPETENTESETENTPMLEHVNIFELKQGDVITLNRESPELFLVLGCTDEVRLRDLSDMSEFVLSRRITNVYRVL